jgi:imidazolonepropionase-like amidohydrolase
MMLTRVRMLAGIAGLLAGVAWGLPASATTAAPPIRLRNVRVLDVVAGELTEPQDILIADGTIVTVEPAGAGDAGARESAAAAAGAAVREIDGTGKIALPGLFDCHTHLTHLTGNGDDSLRTALGEFVRRGVLYVRDVGGPIDVMSDMSRRTASGELRGPTIFYSGPMLEGSPLTWAKFNEDFPGFTVAIDDSATVDSLLPELARQGASYIKTFNHIDRALYAHVVDVARRCGLRIVHDPGTPLFHTVPMDVALDLGVTSIEHAKAPWPIVLRDDLQRKHDALLGGPPNPMAQMPVMMEVVAAGVDGIDLPKLRALAAKMVAKNAYLCPTLFVFAAMADMGDEPEAGADSAQAAPNPQRAMMKKVMTAMEAVSRLFVREFAAAGVKMLVGQDGVDPRATFEEMRLLKECGVDEAEIIRGATIYPARWLGVDDTLGTIAAGKRADLLVVDGNPLEDIMRLKSTAFVIHRGEMITR